MKLTGKILIILLILAFSAMIFACNPKNTDEGDPVTPGQPSNPSEIESVELAEKITNGLKAAGSPAEDQDIRHITSEYTVIVNQINITVTYEADYDLKRKQDSEIMLKVFDNQYQRNTMFIYYYSGILYYEINGERHCIVDFGGTSNFDLFLQFITMFDMDSYFFADPDRGGQDEFIEEEDDYGLDNFSTYLSMIILGAEKESLSVIALGQDKENITIKDVAIDKAKDTLNDFFQNNIKANLGTRLDALSRMLFGFNMSDIGNIGIGILNASLIEIIMEKGVVTDLEVVFDGMLSDNINSFLVSLEYSVSEESKRVKLDKYDDPDLNPIIMSDADAALYPKGYRLTRMGETYLKGTIYVDSLDATFSTEIKSKINAANNKDNIFLVDIRNKTSDLDPSDPYYKNESVVSIFYNYSGDESLYVSLEGLMTGYLGNGIGLTELNFPKVKFETLDIAQEFNLLLNYISGFADEGFSTGNLLGIFGAAAGDNSLKMLFSKIRSDGNTIILDLDTELLSALLGNYSTNIIEWLTSKLGIPSETLVNLMGIGAFDNINMTFTFNSETKEITVSLFNGTERLFKMSLYQEEILGPVFNIEAPEGFEPSTYKNFGTAEAATLHLEAELHMQGNESVDFSNIMGAFIGDVTGKNTPFSFGINDAFYIAADIWMQNGVSYVAATIWFNPVYSIPRNYSAEHIITAPILRIFTSVEDPTVLLIETADGSYADTAVTPLKFRMSREALKESFKELLGEDSLFTTANIMEIYQLLTRDTSVFFKEDWITFTLSPYTSKGINYDPIYELIGIESMLAEFKARITFKAPVYDIIEAQFEEPEIESLGDVDFASMYEARWHDSVDVYFGDLKLNYLLTFRGVTAQLVTGVYHYTPTARLFGKDVSYVMVLTDAENGTKKITELELSKLSIDPTVETPIPEKIGVLYEDGTRGEQPFIIENFPYTPSTIKYALNGMAVRDFYIVIGKGSIAETRFLLPIEVLNRRLVATNYIGNIPIVGILNIDPYQYSLAKKNNPSYNPLSAFEVMELQFYSNKGDGSVINEIVEINWSFDESLITFRGGVYYVFSKINSVDIALEINIYAKIVDYIKIVGENNGEYTVDSLINSTYTIPTGTTSSNEVRIYFKTKTDPQTARYRIIGTAPEGWVNDDPYCDGYYPVALKWLYPVADNVTLDRTINPLNGGRTNINTSDFGDDIAGKQKVTLTVLAPSRRAAQMGDNVQLITHLVMLPSGGIDEVNTVRESIKVSAVGYGEIGSETDKDGAQFIVDPYAGNAYNRLPSKINMTVEFAGKLIRKAYFINWVQSTIIDSSGNILNPTAEESYLMATGWIGEKDGNKQLITMVIHNLSGAFESIVMYDPNKLDGNNNPTLIVPEDGKYKITVNPYDNYKLPDRFILRFSAASGYPDKEYNTEWTMIDDDGNLVYITDGYAFPYTAGEYELITYIAADPSSGILAQTVRLYVNVEDMSIISNRPYGISSDMDAGNYYTVGDIIYVEVDTYSPKSTELLNKLESSDINKIGITFIKDNSLRSNDVPVIWENIELVKSAMRSSEGSSGEPNGIITMRGKIYHGSEALEQDVSISFKVLPRIIRGVNFIKINSNPLYQDVLNVSVNLTNKTITIDLLKPYALINIMIERDYTSEEKLGNLIYDFIDELFGNVRLMFEGSIYGDYIFQYILPEDITERVFDFEGISGYTNVVFEIDKMSFGSCDEGFIVYLNTHKDQVTSPVINRYEETFNQNGTLIPENREGFVIPPTIKIEYQQSGEVFYTNLIWYAEANHYNDGGQIVIPMGAVVDKIPVSLFNKPIWLYTILQPQNEKVSMTINFYSKDIGGYKFNAAADNPAYNIINGKITIYNIYQVYPFDISKIPTVITPVISATYQIADPANPITFGVQWKPSTDFADPNNPDLFSQEKINKHFNYGGYVSDYDTDKEKPFATAEILMYDEKKQTIKLFIEVVELAGGAITHEQIDIDDNAIVIDPYIYNYHGNFVLPKDITVTFKDEITGEIKASYKFPQNADISYFIKNLSGGFDPITNIPYTHTGHALSASQYGEENDILNLYVTLPDGKEINFTVQFLSRELDKVYIENKATKEDGNGNLMDSRLEGYYYIDPYDSMTYQVPMSATFGFLKGDDIVLPVSYWTMTAGAPFDSNYRLIWSSDVYKGGEYEFTSSLSGYGVTEQEFTIKVIILNRSLKYDYDETFHFDNPIAGLVEDIPSTLNSDEFTPLTDDIYSAYNSIATPVIPYIVWQMSNNDIVYGGISALPVNGLITYQGTTGEPAKVTISADKWVFYSLKDVEEQIIEFYPLEATVDDEMVARSVRKSFTVIFVTTNIKTNQVTQKEVTFYPLEWARAGTSEERQIIDWGYRHPSEEDILKTFKIGNKHKSEALSINVVNQYRYSYRQVSITEVDFGFGQGYGATNYAELVIDPINPVVPEKVSARGIDLGTGDEMLIENLTVIWDPVIYNMPLAGDTRTVSADLLSADGTITKFSVIVHYLNRVPVNIYTSKDGFSSSSPINNNPPEKRYILRSTNSAGATTSYFVMDPISAKTYDAATGLYSMPSDITITYKTDYESETLRNALDILGREHTFININWELSGEINLIGTIKTTELGIEENPLTVYLRGFNIRYLSDGSTVISERYDYSQQYMDSRFDLNLNVKCREVEYTSISTKITPTDGSASYQRATSEFYIDPYAVSFPSTVSVKFTDDSVERVYTDIQWIYNGEYLRRTDVISGKILEENPNAMNIMGYIKVFGTTLGVQFPIKPRNIDTSMPGGDGTMPLSGGKLYVLAGKPLRPQLPTFMYYKFVYDGITDIAAVPLSFSDSNLYNISTANPGVTYTRVKGTLGLIDKDNIEFTIEVIDPVVYNIKITYMNDIELYSKGALIYDKILVAINGNNYYIQGKEENILPKVIIINEEGHFLEVVDRVYNIAQGYVTFNCKYTFLSSSDCFDLSGTRDGGEDSDKLTISFNVPITTYNHTKIDDVMLLTNTRMEVPLGLPILASAMPKAYIDGTSNYYDLIWDLGNLNINVAGEYTCYGYYKTTYDNDISLPITIVVNKQQIESDDINISQEWLKRSYTGQVIELVQGNVSYITIKEFLRADGTFGKVQSYKVEYSLDGGNSWIDEQPVQVNPTGTDYKVRITIEDYNVVGFKIFTLKIEKAWIYEDDITFHLTENSPAANSFTYEFSGAECRPIIKGIPVGADYSIKYELYDAVNDVYHEARPFNAGTYRLTLTFPPQENYTSTGISFTAQIVITKKSVDYDIMSEIVYNGRERDAVVLGLPEALGDIKVVYTYYDADGNIMPAGSKIKNAGNYYVTVSIDGGINYPSANFGGNTYANLIMRSFRITKKQVILKVNTLSSEYLEPLLPLNSAVSFVDASNPSLPGLQGYDTVAIFQNGIEVYWEGGNLTYKHMVGDYTLIPRSGIIHQNYDIVGYENGTYSITANAEGAVVINNKAELDSRISNLSDNDKVKWYLRAGNYGSIVINKNATVSIVGSYNLSAATEEIAVYFDSIVVKKGGVTIDIVKMAAVGNTAAVTIEAGASDVTISRSLFYRTGNSYLTGSVAVKTLVGYDNMLSMSETVIKGFAMAVYMLEGSANIQKCEFIENIGAVQVRKADSIILIDNKFSYTRGDAVYIVCNVSSQNLSINGNEFTGNIVAVKSYTEINFELLKVQNQLKYNSIDLQNLY